MFFIHLARKKAEREALLAAEEASLPSKPKSGPKAGSSTSTSKKKPHPSSDTIKPTGAGIAGYSVNDPLGLRQGRGLDGEIEQVQELSAVGLDDMLEALEIVNAKTDRETLGAKVGATRNMTTFSQERLF